MKLKRHINFINESIDRHEGIKTLYLEENGTYNAHDNIVLKNPDVKDNKIIYKFNSHFQFDLKVDQLNLTTLEGVPGTYVYSMHCDNNDLTDLKHSPKRVERFFDCSSNKLTTLEGAPDSCEDFYCEFNFELTDLKGAPRQVSSTFNVNHCDKLTTLEGVPHGVHNIEVIGCKGLTDLKGLPEKFGTINFKGTNVYSLIDLINIDFDDLYWEKSKVSLVEYDYFINEVANKGGSRENYYPDFMEYIKKTSQEYEADAYTNLKVPQELYDTLDDNMKNLFTSIKTTSKYNL